jgi:hypothetical protein
VNTEELVSLLATGIEPVDPRRIATRYLGALVAGTLAALLLVAAVLRFNPALLREFSLPMFWVREIFCSTLSLLGLVATARLARPGTPLGLVPAGLTLAMLGLWALSAVVLVNAPASDRVALLLGHTALVCPPLIALVAIPLFIAFIWALRGLAPTRLRFAGAAAGVTAGATGALVYSLHCSELAAPFIAIWYPLGILIPSALGACLGPRLLRW